MPTWIIAYNSTAVAPDHVTAAELKSDSVGYVLVGEDGTAVWAAPVNIVASIKRADAVTTGNA